MTAATDSATTAAPDVAKSYLSTVKSYSRKLREAILALRLERRYSKRAILALYLNQIFLGNGAYGVQAAARRYFDKDVTQLDLNEMAMIDPSCPYSVVTPGAVSAYADRSGTGGTWAAKYTYTPATR